METRTCENCGRPYETDRYNQRFCSYRCQQAAYKRRIRKQTKDEVPSDL